MTRWVKTLWIGVAALSLLSCSVDPNIRPERPATDPVEVGPTKMGKADGFDWGDGCKDGSGTFSQAIAKAAVVTVGDIPSGRVNVEIKLTSDKDVDIQLFDEDGTKIVQWPDGMLNGDSVGSKTYKGVTIKYSGYNGDGTNLGHEYIKLTGETTTKFTMKAYGYAAGSAQVDYKWAAKPDCDDSGSGSFTQPIEKDAVATVGTIPAGKSDIKIQLTSTVDIDIQLFDKDGAKLVHWPDGQLKGATKESMQHKGVKITWSGYNGDGTSKGNEYIEIEGKTATDYTMKAFGYQAGTAKVDYSWGKTQGGSGTVTAKVIFSPVSSTSKSHVAEVVKLIKAAKYSVDIAIYSLSDNRVNTALKEAVEKTPPVKVRMIFHPAQEDRKSATPCSTKSGKLEIAGIDVRYASKSRVMHNKYMIVDGAIKDSQGQVATDRAKDAWVATGSGNWSGGAQTNYDENTVFLKGVPKLALLYQQDFNRLWNYSHDFVCKSFTYNTAPTLDASTFPTDANTEVFSTVGNFKKNLTWSVIKGNYVVATDVVKEMNKATTSIYVASGHFRSWPVYDALVKLKIAKPNLDIKVYLDGQEYISEYYSDKKETETNTCIGYAGSDTAKQLECRLSGNYYSYQLHKAHIPLRFKYYCYRWDYHYAKQMHNKYIVIDGKTLLTGSYNLSDNAERGSMENVVVLKGADYKGVVDDYVASFTKMWETDKSGSKLASLKNKVQNDSTIPLVFQPMALTWDQITSLKALIKSNCSLINSTDYKKNPNSHKTCPRNP
jgi:phosphatidylserine/phosphatidylglycerophosphate/cardiolipin synthase-like enzyme